MGAQTEAALFTSTTQWKWSESLSRAAREIAHTTGPCATAYTTEDYIEVAWDTYVKSFCHNVEVQGTYTNGAAFTGRDLMDDWLTNNKFADTTLHDDTYSDIGVGCTCDTVATVYCMIIFANNLIGKNIANVPKWTEIT